MHVKYAENQQMQKINQTIIYICSKTNQSKSHLQWDPHRYIYIWNQCMYKIPIHTEPVYLLGNSKCRESLKTTPRTVNCHHIRSCKCPFPTFLFSFFTCRDLSIVLKGYFYMQKFLFREKKDKYYFISLLQRKKKKSIQQW